MKKYSKNIYIIDKFVNKYIYMSNKKRDLEILKFV